MTTPARKNDIPAVKGLLERDAPDRGESGAHLFRIHVHTQFTNALMLNFEHTVNLIVALSTVWHSCKARHGWPTTRRKI